MLKKIVFFIADERQIMSINIMKRNLGKISEMIDIWKISELKYVTEYEKGYEKTETLFVTDEQEILRVLKEHGTYVIVYLHNGNKEQDLSEAAFAITDIEDLNEDSFEKAYLRLAGMPWTIAETNRCCIRETTVADVDAFYDIYAEPSVTCYMESLFEEPEEEREYTKEYIRRVYGFYGYGLWSVVQKDYGKVIGRAGISWREGFDIPELGFVIAVPWQHQGYAYEVCRAILAYGMEQLQFDKVQALIKKGNEASVKLCEKLGFVWTDRVEDKGNLYERYILAETESCY